MIALRKLVSIVLIVLLGASCSGKSQLGRIAESDFESLFGSSPQGVSVSRDSSSISVSINSVPTQGVFLRVPLGAGFDIVEENWVGVDNMLHLALAYEGGIELGVVPLKGFQGSSVTAELLTGVLKDASVPPVGEGNVITDLRVSDAGGGQVLLEWTQVNVGDYDLNGEVNLSDLAPIAINFQDTYSLLGPAAMSDPLYWIDGMHDGEINLSDISPIGIHYGSAVLGYNIRQNGNLLTGAPTILATDGISGGSGLPNGYSVVLPGLVTDSWNVTAVDHDLVEGADSDGNLGPLDLLANIDISGQLLLDFDGLNPGGFNPSKMSSRVIIDVEEVDSATVGEVNISPLTGIVEVYDIDDVPDRTVYLQFFYLPSIDLATGDGRFISRAKQSSAVAEEFMETVTIPVRIPESDLPVVVEASLGLAEVNPSGGFYVHLITAITYPGDDKSTPDVVETEYTVTTPIRMDVVGDSVSIDTDGNGDFDDEVEMEDADHDCLSHRRAEQENDDHEYDDDERDEIEIEGVISAFDEGSGLITLINAIQDQGDPIEIPIPFTLFFSENTRFEEKIKVDGGDDIERDIDPSTLQVGDEVEVDLYLLEDSGGSQPTKYWIEKIERRIEEPEEE